MSDDDRRAAATINRVYKAAAARGADGDIAGMEAVIALRGLGWRLTAAQPPPDHQTHRHGPLHPEPTDAYRQAKDALTRSHR